MAARRVLRPLLIVAGAALLLLIVLELGFRLTLERFDVDVERMAELRQYLDEGLEKYRPHPFMGYTKDAKHSRRSPVFVSAEFPRERTPGVVRVACLGGSTTASAYPRRLWELLEEHLQEPVEVMNWGVAAWTSAETMINYFLNVQAWRPDVVVIHHAVNDTTPRVWPGFRADYSHFRRTWQYREYGALRRLLTLHSDLFAWSELRRPQRFEIVAFVNEPLRGSYPPDGRLDPRTDVAFRRNVETICDHLALEGSLGVLATMPWDRDPARLVGARERAHRQGILEHNAILRQIAAERGLVLADLEAWQDEQPELFAGHFKDLVHTRAEGTRMRALGVFLAMEREGLLERARLRAEGAGQ